MRIIVIGDVHGCLDEFDDLTYAVRYVQGVDRLISLGDLMDRGPKPAACVAFARQSGAEIVQSNHDDKHVRYRRHLLRKSTDPKYSGSAPKLKPEDIRQNEILSDEDVAWIGSAPNVIRISEHNTIAVHAGLLSGVTPEEMPMGVCVRCRWVTEDGKMAPSEHDERGQHQRPVEPVFQRLVGKRIADVADHRRDNLAHCDVARSGRPREHAGLVRSKVEADEEGACLRGGRPGCGGPAARSQPVQP